MSRWPRTASRTSRRWLDRAAIIATDELPAYRSAGHIRVNHSADEFAPDDLRTGLRALRAHVNTAESLHALLKQAISFH